ncbi:MAG: helix-turn-helix domain-containing protein [Gracilibacteraceae bacterium]|nr:helix-turn-helix domain-containing protein [Gracilibacteraceae bacterium]
MRKSMCPVQPFFLVNTTKYYKILGGDEPIAHYYSFTADNGDARHSVAVPDGCVDMLFTEYGGEIEGHLCGMVTKGESLSLRQGSRCFGVRFLPGFLPERLEVSIPELVNRRVGIGELSGGAGLLENIAGTQDFVDRTILLRDYIGGAWRCSELLQMLTQIVCELGGGARVRDLEKKTLYSARYINRIFKQNLGLSPKVFSEHVRFQSLLSNMNANGCDRLSDLAAKYGYCDQSHFTHEFKTFAAVTPGEYHGVVDLPHYKEKFVYLSPADSS